MLRVIKSLGYLSFIFLCFSCKKDDEVKIEPPRDRAEVYKENLTDIESFLKTHTLEVHNKDVQFTEVDQKNPKTIWLQKEFPLQSVELKNDNRKVSNITELVNDEVTYKVYYLILNEGKGTHPWVYDDVQTSYNLYNMKAVKIDENHLGFWSSFPEIKNSKHTGVISGYRQILGKIKTASKFLENTDGTFSFENSGRVLVFIPSGLGYFDGAAKVGAYASLIFDIKLNASQAVDHDNDGILSKYEDINKNGDLWDDDTDKDGIPDFLDIDDDADGKTTREEITYEATNAEGEVEKKLYDFDEIPTCSGGTTKKHLDKSCQ